MCGRKGLLTNKLIHNWDNFVKQILDSYTKGELTLIEAVSCIGHVVSAIDIGNIGEVTFWVTKPEIAIESIKKNKK